MLSAERAEFGALFVGEFVQSGQFCQPGPLLRGAYRQALRQSHKPVIIAFHKIQYGYSKNSLWKPSDGPVLDALSVEG